MAIQILDQPENDSPAYSPNIYVVLNDDDNTEDNFKYIARVFNSTFEFIGELKATPNPQYGWGKFDLSSIVGDQLKEQIDFDTLIYQTPDVWENIEVRFGWEYMDTTGDFIRVEDNVSNTKTYFNGSPFYNEFVKVRELAGDGQHPYVITPGTGYPKFPLTSRRKIETRPGTKQWLYYLRGIQAASRNIDVRNDDTGNIQRIELSAPFRQDSVRMIGVRVDKEAVESQTSHSNLERWSIRTSDINLNASSEWISYELLPCNRWDEYSLYYLNRWGGFDSMSFSGKSTKTIRTERETFKTNNKPIGQNGIVDYSTTNHSTKDYWVKTSNRIQLWTDWINYESKVSAIDLQSSPLVWMEDKDGVILPVTITQNTFNIDDNNVSDVISLSMEVEYQQPTNRQRV